MAVFTGFHAYDDEGYFLITLRDYLGGQPLLNPAVPIYGPFFFETIGGIFKLLGVAPGHDAGRYVTAAIWVIASLVSGLTTYRLTRSLWLGVTAELVMFHVLGALTGEPSSPSGLVALLLVCLAAAAALWAARPRAAAVVIGAIVGALCLVKINVGVFAALAATFAWAYRPAPRWRVMLVALILIVISWLPLLLTGGLFLRQLWVAEFAVGLAISSTAVAWTGFLGLPFVDAKRLPPASGPWLAAGGIAVVATSLAIALAGGSNLQDMWNGLVVVALRLPRVFTWPLQINPLFDVWAAVVAVLAFANWYTGRLRAAGQGAVRVGAGLFTLVAALLLPSSIFLLALPLAWIAAVRPAGDQNDPVGTYPRLLLPALAVLEALQAYPVAGTQLSMAAVSLVPVGAIILADGVHQLQRAASPRRARLADWAAPVALLAGVQVLLLVAYLAAAGYSAGTPLRLPGAESVRVPAQQAGQLHDLVAAIDHDCKDFITMPGMNSLYLWTGQQPPVAIRSEVWMLTLDGSQQQAFVNQLQPMSGLCVVENLSLVDFWRGGGPVPQGPLLDFIQQNFQAAGTFGDYQLLTRRQ